MELKNTVTIEKKFTTGIQDQIDQAEERISELKDMLFEVIQSEEKRMKNSEESLRDLQDTII